MITKDQTINLVVIHVVVPHHSPGFRLEDIIPILTENEYYELVKKFKSDYNDNFVSQEQDLRSFIKSQELILEMPGVVSPDTLREVLRNARNKFSRIKNAKKSLTIKDLTKDDIKHIFMPPLWNFLSKFLNAASVTASPYYHTEHIFILAELNGNLQPFQKR